MHIRPKKRLGQHFLTDKGVVRQMIQALGTNAYRHLPVLEVGAGTGALTDALLAAQYPLLAVEADEALVSHLSTRYGQHPMSPMVMHADFLNLNLNHLPQDRMQLVGNLPYMLSSPILWRVFWERKRFPHVLCMLQQEVAERICAAPGSRTYGILSVLLQTFYTTEFLFKVPAQAFRPPPKVQSAVIRLLANGRSALPCPDQALARVVKLAFGQRRKTLKNALQSQLKPTHRLPPKWANLRAEALSADEFIALTCYLSNHH